MARVFVATPTWNRLSIITLTAAALKESDLCLDRTEYMVTDDASNEYSEADLVALFPWASVVRQRQKFQHPLLNTQFCFNEFLRGTCDYLVILDSDMIVSKDWRARLDALLQTPNFTVGSIYNSNNHAASVDNGDYVIKATVGFAGSVISRQAATMLREQLGRIFDDWTMCRTMGPIFHVAKPSAVAHIGIYGLWNKGGYSEMIDKALDFDWNSVSPELKAACETLLQTTL